MAYSLTMNAVNAAFLEPDQKAGLRDRIRTQWPKADDEAESDDEQN
jgi:hypothetical protein